MKTQVSEYGDPTVSRYLHLEDGVVQTGTHLKIYIYMGRSNKLYSEPPDSQPSTTRSVTLGCACSRSEVPFGSGPYGTTGDGDARIPTGIVSQGASEETEEH